MNMFNPSYLLKYQEFIMNKGLTEGFKDLLPNPFSLTQPTSLKNFYEYLTH